MPNFMVDINGLNYRSRVLRQNYADLVDIISN